MNTALKALSVLKLIMSGVLCMYTVLSVLFFVYVRFCFSEPVYFLGLSLWPFAISIVVILNLAASLFSASHTADILCAALSFAAFFALALMGSDKFAWYFACYTLIILLLSVILWAAHLLHNRNSSRTSPKQSSID